MPQARRGGFPVRYKLVGILSSLAALTYLDRVCISTMAPAISKEFGLTQVQMSWVFSAFTLAYAAFEIPTAWWADKIGSRRVVTRIVAWWSSFTVLTAAAVGYPMLLTIRFLFGVGEAGAWPNAARVFSRWIPARERGKVQGVFFAGAHLSGGVTPLLVTWMLTLLPWRQVFLVCGATGFLWATGWYLWYRDDPAEHPAVSAEERDLILRERNLAQAEEHDAKSFRAVFRHPSTWFLCIMYIANTYGTYFFITFLPTYLHDARGFSKTQLAVFSGMPLTLSVVADLFGGAVTDWCVKRFGVRIGRCSVGFAGYLAAAIGMGIAAATSNAWLSGWLIAVGGAASMFTLGASWACCIDIGEHRSGVMGAVMNTSGNIGGFVSPLAFAYLMRAFSNHAIPVYVLASLYAIAAISWLMIRPDRSLTKFMAEREATGLRR